MFVSMKNSKKDSPAQRQWLLILAIQLGLVLSLDEDACLACVDRNCGYCVVDGKEACVCTQAEFDQGSSCNGGSRSFKTTTGFACSEEGRRTIVAIVVVLIGTIIGCSIFWSWFCCCRTHRSGSGGGTNPTVLAAASPAPPNVWAPPVVMHPASNNQVCVPLGRPGDVAPKRIDDSYDV